MNTFELKPTDEQRVSNDTSLPTHNLPTRQRQEVGAADTDNLTDIQQKINEYRTAIRSGSLTQYECFCDFPHSFVRLRCR